jgi:hypothetical protein
MVKNIISLSYTEFIEGTLNLEIKCQWDSFSSILA